jgi:hypothetical protein
MQSLTQKLDDADIFRDLAPFRVGTDIRTGLQTYFIEDTLAFQDQFPQMTAAILKQCDDVQKSVWNPKNPIYENVFSPGLLFLVGNAKQIKGFFSAETFEIGSSKIGLYFSDCMATSDLHGKGLFKTVSLYITEHLFKARPEIDVVFHVIVTGNLFLFKHYVQSSFMGRVDINEKSEDTKTIYKQISSYFPHTKIEDSGVLRCAWAPQFSPSEKWVREQAQQWNFPLDVDFNKGDVFACNFTVSQNQRDLLRRELQLRIQAL